MRFLWKKDKSTLPPDGGNGSAPTGETQLVYEFFTLSETGPTRSSNEDSILSFYPDRHRRSLFAMVADGMGGHLAGEVASRLACDFSATFMQLHYTDKDPSAKLSFMLKQAHLTIADTASKNTDYKGMGTTATALHIYEGKMHFAHVGDSRLYLLRHQKLRQLTTDHTLVNQWLAEGKITEAESINHPNKNVITQALGTVEQVYPQIGTADFALQNGDRFFLCSDGIYDVLTNEELEDLLNMRNAKMAMDCMRLLCNHRMGADNFSAILITVSEKEIAAPAGITKEQNIPV